LKEKLLVLSHIFIIRAYIHVFIFLLNLRFKNWGGKDPHRIAEDVAYSMARFFQSGGTFQNYYMVTTIHS